VARDLQVEVACAASRMGRAWEARRRDARRLQQRRGAADAHHLPPRGDDVRAPVSRAGCANLERPSIALAPSSISHGVRLVNHIPHCSPQRRTRCVGRPPRLHWERGTYALIASQTNGRWISTAWRFPRNCPRNQGLDGMRCHGVALHHHRQSCPVRAQSRTAGSRASSLAPVSACKRFTWSTSACNASRSATIRRCSWSEGSGTG
jgi:hypothetical protein